MANDFLAFAADAAANVMTQAEYADAAFVARTLGFSSGTAASLQLNKVWRQASLISHMLGNFIFTETTHDALDDGTPSGLTKLQTDFRLAVHNVAVGSVGTGYLPLTGGSLSGPLTVNSTHLTLNSAGADGWLTLNRHAGSNAVIMGETNGSPRWMLLLPTNTPETGANAGSNLTINRFSDAGLFLGTTLSINRATGVVDFAAPPTVGGGLMPYVPIAGGNMTGALGVGSTGVSYPGLGGFWGQHHTAFGWDGTWMEMAVDGVGRGQIATVAWVQANLAGVEGEFAGYLPLTGGALSGGLTVHSSMIVDGTIFCGSNVYFGGASDFLAYGSADYRVLQWAGSWADVWATATGWRTWTTYAGPSMSLSPTADLYVGGIIRADGGRIIAATASWRPSVSAWNEAAGRCDGFWSDTDAMWFGWMDGNGEPMTGVLALSRDGNTVTRGGLFVGTNMSVGNGVDTGSIWVTTSASFDWLDVRRNGAQITGGVSVNTGGIGVANGNVTVNGMIYSYVGRIISEGSGGREPSFSLYNTSSGATGWWLNSSNVTAWGGFDGAGNPQTVYGWFHGGMFMCLTAHSAASYNIVHYGTKGGLTDADIDAIPGARVALAEGPEIAAGEQGVDVMALIDDLYRRVKLLEGAAA